MADIVNTISTSTGVKNAFTNKTVYLVNDIVVNKGTASATKWTPATYTDADGNSQSYEAYGWPVIGIENTSSSVNKKYRFNGVFDGQMHTISGVYYSYGLKDANNDYYAAGGAIGKQGLFACLGANATVQNFYLKNSFFKYSGQNNHGSIAGQMAGCTMKNVYNEAYIYSADQIIGGMVGASTTSGVTIENCEFAGTITGYHTNSKATMGGIIPSPAKAGDTIKNCKFSGTIDMDGITASFSKLGGIIGNSTGATIENCLSSGTIKVNDKVTIYGMIAGTYTALTCTNVYATKSLSYDVADSVGYTGVTMIDNAADAGAGLGYYTEDQTRAWVLTTDVDPVLKVFNDEYLNVTSTFAATDTDGTGLLFTIKTADELYAIADISKTENFSTDTISLANDIVMNEGNSDDWKSASKRTDLRIWNGIGTDGGSYRFSGEFDGNGYTISGVCLYQTDANFYGLFRAITSEAYIHDFKLMNSYFDTPGKGMTSAIVGRARGGSLENIYTDAYVSGSQRLGGIVGQLISGSTITISNCWFDGVARATGGDADGRTGGIVGDLLGTAIIMNCLNTGVVKVPNMARDLTAIGAGGLVGGSGTDSTLAITNCLNAGTVEYNSDATGGYGSLVGFALGTYTISNSYAVKGTLIPWDRTNGEALDALTDTATYLVGGVTDAIDTVELVSETDDMPYLTDTDAWTAVEGSHPVLTIFAE